MRLRPCDRFRVPAVRGLLDRALHAGAGKDACHPIESSGATTSSRIDDQQRPPDVYHRHARKRSKPYWRRVVVKLRSVPVEQKSSSSGGSRENEKP